MIFLDQFGVRVACMLMLIGIGLAARYESSFEGRVIMSPRTEDLLDRERRNNQSVIDLSDNPKTLDVCECEAASGSPNGLSCEKEGWFISSFEQAGQWSSGGGWVPLSRAICCRLCLPKEVPGAKGQEAVAVISIGCHPSSNSGPSVLKCESSGGSFVTGWAEALRIPDARQYYYPVGAVECCTPSLLLSNGDARPLERCDCVNQNDVNCGGTDTSRLLTGYTRWGGDRSLTVPPLDRLVPIAPSVCCKSCVSDSVIPSGSCFDLNFCSGHGSCNLGSCECVAGYGGADCSHRVQMDPGGLPGWAIAIIVLSSVAVALLLLIIVVRVGQYCAEEVEGEEEEGSEEGDELREPLIAGLGSDDEGSVGSEDSSICGEDEHMPPPLSRRQPPVEEAAGGGTFVTPEEQEAANRALREEESETVPPRAESSEISQEAPEVTAEETEEAGEIAEDEEVNEEAMNALRVQADQLVIHGIRQAEAQHTATDSTQELDKKCKEEKDRGGLPGIFCSVCLNRPVQVAVVPCGHMCLCRRCSRRLLTCPVCRMKILRRQRIFLGG